MDDKKAWEKILKMYAAGFSLKQMTQGTGLKRSRILRLLDEKRAAAAPEGRVKNRVEKLD